jgi:hypothetical protein
MTRYVTAMILLLCSLKAQASFHRLTGIVTDSTGTALDGASISLLYPEDSTLAVFGISNKNGSFSIVDAKDGTYVLQVAMMGYYTEYINVNVPYHNDNNLGRIVLKTNEAGTLLKEVVVSGERVPVRVKGDTLEYNAGSYKVKPDAMVEDLLRKLPGVQVDKEGNIKSMGKNVSKVLVDGKEFFGNDPKVATKNLPADAIDKIQAFEKKSDGTLFTGIDDGTREQTLNLMLKDGKKTGYFGEATGGIGVPEKYDASLKAFKFRPKSQLAALGMLNNINKFGFSFDDYLNFNGGLNSLLQSGGRLEMDGDDLPLDFGQPVKGDITSGAAGLNYTIEPWQKSSLSLHYLGNGARKFLDEYTSTRNYTPDDNFVREDHATSNNRNFVHRFSSSWRSEIDSVHMLTVNAAAQVGSDKSDEWLQSSSSMQDALLNTLDNRNYGTGTKTEFGGNVNWFTKLKGNWPVLQANLQAAYKGKNAKDDWNNITTFPSGGQRITDDQYRNNNYEKRNTSMSVSATRTLGNNLFLTPSFACSFEREMNNRVQGPQLGEDIVTDSLSPSVYRNVVELAPGLELKKNKKQIQWSIALKASKVWLNPYLNSQELFNRSYNYLLPSLSFHKDFGTGKRLSLRYSTDANAPGALQMLPVKDYRNPLLRTVGNPDLKPEYAHSVDVNYNHFDQFTMTSFYIFLSGKYTLDKIDWNRIVQPDLSQDLQTFNTPYASQLRMNTQYARPVRKLGINMSVGLTETWNKSVSGVNGINNTNSTFNHVLDLSFNNLSNDILDIRCGGNIEFSTARYSINRELNNNYFNYSAFASINYRPSKNWNFLLSGDLTRYTAQSFDAPVTVPLLKAEVSRYILPNQRGTITLRGFDLLDKNKSILRSSQLNYLMEQRSNIIGRYLMLSFAYKLNKAGSKGNAIGGIEIRH